MSYVPQMINRRVGEVEILDLKGDFVGPWAVRGKEDIERFVETHKPKNLIINLKDVESIDSLGVKAIIDNLRGGIKGGIVSGNYSVAEMFSRLELEKETRFFRDEDEVIQYFAEELVKEPKETFIEEKRKYPRLKTAYPLEFWYRNQEGDEVLFRAIITNLSLGGLYAEYLDLETLASHPRNLDPYDFKMLNLKIKLNERAEITAEGKVVRIDTTGDQIGIAIQFYKVSEEERRKIEGLIAKE